MTEGGIGEPSTHRAARVRAGPVAAVLCVASACAPLPSEYNYLSSTPAKAEHWLTECDGNLNDMLRKERYCTLAIKSKDVRGVDKAFAFATRGVVFYTMASEPNAEPDWATARVRDAIEDFDVALRITPSDPVVLRARGDAFYALGDAARANADYRAAERAQP